jgi:hypothetical protein
MAFWIAYSTNGDPAAITEYLGRYRTTGEAIDHDTVYLGVAIVLGVLSEISLSLARATMRDEPRQTEPE